MKHFPTSLALAAVIHCLSGTPRVIGQTSPFDPQGYLDDKAREDAKKNATADAVKQAVVEIDGRPYYKFGTDRGAIYLPKVDHLSKFEMEKSVCAEDLISVCDPNRVGMETDSARRNLCAAEGLKEATLARADMALTDDTSLYAGWIIQTIQTTCGGQGRQPNATEIARLLEIGLEWKSKDPRHPGAKKIYIRPFPPQLGVGSTF